MFGVKKLPKNPSLNGKMLPWVNKIKYLGTFVTNKYEPLKNDIETN